jgi:hypothetical protein
MCANSAVSERSLESILWIVARDGIKSEEMLLQETVNIVEDINLYQRKRLQHVA